MERWRNVKHKRCFIMLCIMYAALSYRKIIADLGWLISARQGSNPVPTDLFQDKLEQETSLQPGYRCIFQLQQTAPIIIRWLDGIASWALRWTLYDRIPPLVESLVVMIAVQCLFMLISHLMWCLPVVWVFLSQSEILCPAEHPAFVSQSALWQSLSRLRDSVPNNT